MGRRLSGARGMAVPGVRDALAGYCRRSASTWGSARFAAVADALDAGEPVEVDGELVWRALFDPRHPAAADRFLHDSGRYVVTGPDHLEQIREHTT